MKELLRAILDHAKSDSTLYDAVSSDFYYDQAPPDTTMPYITYFVVDDGKRRTFAKAKTFQDTLIQFSIFDDRSSVENVETIYSDLDLAFDRAVLTYVDKTAIGCAEESKIGPRRLEDCWMTAVTYRIWYV